MLLSKSCIYGLRAAMYLAANKENEYVSIGQISSKLNISFHFLTKILQQLTADGLMESVTGPRGGIRLSEKGKKATLLDIVIAIDGVDMFTQCVLGLPGCGTSKPCPLHYSWAENREKIKSMLERTNLEKLALESKANDYRITAENIGIWG